MLKTKYPVYLYGNAELPRRGDGALFHYTRLEKFLTILEDLTLLPSSFGKLNDMNEGNVSNMNLNRNFKVMFDAEKYVQERCHILSFSQNYDEYGFCQEGTNHPAMWAHYADDSNGVCIVIDKEAFISKNLAVFDSHFYQFKDVEYSIFNTPKDDEIDVTAKTPEQFIMDNWKALFFLKHKDWENEDEHRLFIMDYDGKLSIDGCIKYVTLGRKLFMDKGKIKEIMDMVVNPAKVCYHKLVPHSFATMCYDNHGYTTFEIASFILAVVNANRKDEWYEEYIRWLREEGYDVK